MEKQSDIGSRDPEDGEESSSSNVEEILANFREKWQRELKSTQTLTDKKETRHEKESKDSENNAKALFLKGIDMEKAGKVYEAIQFYRRAVQIVPDIEFRLDFKGKSRDPELEEKSLEELTEEKEDVSTDSETEEIPVGQLLTRIQKAVSKNNLLCSPKTVQQATHISALPLEIIFLILRWVVSTDLDLRSLESFSMVCRGFYLCARDIEIWRLACLRVWGLNCSSYLPNYSSWRDMFIERGRVHFNGCYISKTTYIRHGENSFQDQFYRPWHLVAYYRYFRFFPDGLVLVLTSPEEPNQSVGKLRYRSAPPPVLSGYYRLKDDKVSLIVQKQKKKKGRSEGYDNIEYTFHMELEIKNSRRKRHVQLVWTHYSVFTKSTKGDESTCNFELSAASFPPLWFSRVKSYTSEATSPLY